MLVLQNDLAGGQNGSDFVPGVERRKDHYGTESVLSRGEVSSTGNSYTKIR